VRLGFVRHGILSVKRRIYWETQLFARVRDWSDGITFFEFKINFDRYVGEHSPSFQLELTILNVYNHLWIHQNNWENEYE
jgi:hypothetical protein